jgi:hypothetical protein
MDMVRPIIIASPVSGSPIRPRLIRTERAGKIYEEAHWYCPDSGQFIKKGTVSITDKPKPSKD